MKSILDPNFCYTPSADTDLRKTFDRIRHELQLAAAVGPRRERSVLSLQRGSAGLDDFRHLSARQEKGRMQRPS